MQNILPDRYDFQARLGPLALVVSPLLLGVLVWTGIPTIPAAIVMTSGLAVFGKWLAGVGRRRGKKIEKRLFASWGGGRATARLRCRDTSNSDPVELASRRQRASRLLPETRFPTEEDEMRDPAAADAVYDRAVRAAIERHRGHNLVHGENCGYGLARNLYGLKPFGIATSVIGLVSVAFKLASLLERFGTETLVALGYGALIIGIMTWFIFGVSSASVRRHNEQFADALYNALQGMDLPVQPNALRGPGRL